MNLGRAIRLTNTYYLIDLSLKLENRITELDYLIYYIICGY